MRYISFDCFRRTGNSAAHRQKHAILKQSHDNFVRNKSNLRLRMLGAPLYLVLSLTLGTTRTHSRFWNDDSSHSVFVKVNWNER